MDYSKGKAAIDLTYRPNLDVNGTIGIEGSVKGESGEFYLPEGKFDGDGIDWGITLGMGNNFALQYRQYNPKIDLYNQTFNAYGFPVFGVNLDTLTVNLDGKIKTEEFNLMYKINKNLSAFTGVVRGSIGARLSGSITSWQGGPKPEVLDSGSLYLPELRTKDETMWQVGLLGSTSIAEKTNLYGLVAFGADYRNWEAGLSYELSKDLELNVSYRNAKFDNFEIAKGYYDGQHHNWLAANVKDVEVKGWGLGVTYKF